MYMGVFLCDRQSLYFNHVQAWLKFFLIRDCIYDTEYKRNK